MNSQENQENSFSWDWNGTNSQSEPQQSFTNDQTQTSVTEHQEINPKDVYPEYDNPYYVQFISEAEMFNHLFQLGNKLEPDTLSNEADWVLFSEFLKKKGDEYVDACQDDDIGRVLQIMSELLFMTGSYVMKHGLKKKIWEGFLELNNSQLTKSAPDAKVAKESVEKYLKENPHLKEEDIEIKQFGNRFSIKDKTINRIVKPTTYRQPTFINYFDNNELASPTVNYANKANYFGLQRKIRELGKEYTKELLSDYEFPVNAIDLKVSETPNFTNAETGENMMKPNYKVFIPEQNPQNRWEGVNNEPNIEDSLNFPQSQAQEKTSTQEQTEDAPPKINWNNEWNFDNDTQNNT